MDANDCGMLSTGNFALFWTMGGRGVVGPRGGKMKILINKSLLALA